MVQSEISHFLNEVFFKFSNDFKNSISQKYETFFLGSFKIQFTMFLDIYLKTFYVVKFFPPSNMKCILKCEMKNF